MMLRGLVRQDRQCTYKRDIEARSRNHFCHGKSLSNSCSYCVSVALVIQHAMRVRRVILSSVASPATQYFSTLSHRRHDFRKKKLLNIKCVFWFSLQLLSETFLILRRTERDMIKSHRSSCEVPIIRVRRLWNLSFFDRSSNYTQISNLMKIRPVRAEVIANGSDMTKLIASFRTFANAPKMDPKYM